MVCLRRELREREKKATIRICISLPSWFSVSVFFFLPALHQSEGKKWRPALFCVLQSVSNSIFAGASMREGGREKGMLLVSAARIQDGFGFTVFLLLPHLRPPYSNYVKDEGRFFFLFLKKEVCPICQTVRCA